MDYGLPAAYLLFAIGCVQLMFGLVFIAGHAWKRNKVFGILTALLPFLIGVYWSMGPYKADKEAPLKELRLALFFSGMVIMLLSMVLLLSLWSFLATLGYMSNQLA